MCAIPFKAKNPYFTFTIHIAPLIFLFELNAQNFESV